MTSSPPGWCRFKGVAALGRILWGFTSRPKCCHPSGMDFSYSNIPGPSAPRRLLFHVDGRQNRVDPILFHVGAPKIESKSQFSSRRTENHVSLSFFTSMIPFRRQRIENCVALSFFTSADRKSRRATPLSRRGIENCAEACLFRGRGPKITSASPFSRRRTENHVGGPKIATNSPFSLQRTGNRVAGPKFTPSHPLSRRRTENHVGPRLFHVARRRKGDP